MANRKNFWGGEDDPFDGEFDQSVFGDDDIDNLDYADDDFEKYFDKNIVEEELHSRGNTFGTDDDNFGRDGYTRRYSTDGGFTEEKISPSYEDDLEKTRFVEKPLHKDIREDELQETKKIDLKESLKNTFGKAKTAAEEKLKKRQTGDGDEEMSGNRRKTSGRKPMNGLTYLIMVLCCSCLLAGLVWIMSVDVLGFTSEDAEVTVTIPKDFTMGEVAKILEDEDVISFKLLFRIFAGISNADEKISGGTYVLNKNYDYRAIINGMTKSGSKKVEVEIVIPEGYTMAQIFELLEQQKVCYADELWETAKNHNFEYDFLDQSTVGQERRLEGYLFPDTYKFYMNDTATNVIKKMLDNYNTKITEEYKEKAQSLGYSMRDIITVASIIEREAAGDADRANIASVIYNRLENASGPTAGYLQLDSTINYIIYGTDQEFSTEIDSPYNTYLHKGLPAGPISNPGIKAIEAALNPANTNYYYFAIDKNQVTQFFSSYNAFMNFVNSDEYGG